jgi:NAD+ kinase
MVKQLRIGITSKVYRPDIIKAAKETAAYLDGKCKLYMKKELASKTGFKGPSINFKTTKLDIIMPIGGDGTLLHTVDQIKGRKIGVLGIKRGSKGFLTEVDHDMEKKLDAVLRGDYFIDEHLKLNVYLNDKNLGDVLNDVVLSTALLGKIQKFDIEVHGDAMDTVSADGIILSTPTGSTAYALSAGGPVLDPTLDAYEITPISPFRLNSRSIVIPANAVTKVKIVGRHNGIATLDGFYRYKIKKTDTLKITRSKNKAYFIKFNKNYLRKVRKALS